MKYMITIFRILLGLIFVVFGLNGFFCTFSLHPNFRASQDSSWESFSLRISMSSFL